MKPTLPDIPAPPTSNHDPSPVSFEAHRAQRRRAAAAAQADARSRRLIWNGLLTLLTALALLTAGVAFDRERQIKGIEGGSQSW